MTADFSYSLEALERRWQVEKTPQVGLRLAEEHRKNGDLEASIETLAAGLEVYPNHTASRVALSRYLVDGARFSEAVDHLEQIVSLDPAHLVANKLLVGAYAGVGRIEDARDKLAIYEMMGEGDSDIERLQELVRDAEASRDRPLAPAASTEDSGEGDSEAETVLPARETGAEDRTDSAAGALGEESSPVWGTRSDGPEPAPAAETSPLPAGADEEAFAPPAAEPAAAPQAAASPDEPFGAAFEATPASSYWDQVADEGIFALDQESSEAAPEAEDTGDEPASEAASPPAAGEAAGAGATITLGKLYLEQGHREQAAEAFEEVLAREPNNQAARRELEAVTQTGSTAVPLDSTASPVDRRRAALETYRDRLRKAIAAGI